MTPDPPSWYGRTRQNRLVHFSASAPSRGAVPDGPQPGELITVRIERTSSWSLVGAAVESILAEA